MPSSSIEITRLLQAWNDGDETALERLTPLVYDELHRLARGYMRRENPGNTLQTTALINEAILRLIDWEGAKWENRAHFYGVVAQMMRRILVDYARTRTAARRGGLAQQVLLDESALVASARNEEFIALDEALARLEQFDPRKAHIVEMRFFGGRSVEETAAVLNLSPRTIVREWTFARAWLHREMSQTQRGNA